MSNETFEIRFKRIYDNQVYRAMVEITHRSENVIRLTVRAGTKEMKMEKLLFRKNNHWKITRMSFEMKGNTKTNAMLIMEIQKAIDHWLKEKLP